MMSRQCVLFMIMQASRENAVCGHGLLSTPAPRRTSHFVLNIIVCSPHWCMSAISPPSLPVLDSRNGASQYTSLGHASTSAWPRIYR